MAADDDGDKPKKKKKKSKPKTRRERWAKSRNKRKKVRAEKKVAKADRVNAAAKALRGGDDGARLPRLKPLEDDFGKVNDKISDPKPPKKKGASKMAGAMGGKSPDEARNQEQQRRADRASDEAKKRRVQDERKNTPEYKRGEKHLGKPGPSPTPPKKAPPIPRNADPLERARMAKFGQKQTKSAPKGATRNEHGTFETRRERGARKGQATKVRRNAMRKKYAAKEPSPVSKTARQRARDINTMNRSEPKNTGNIYADKDLAHEKKRISSKSTYRPPGSRASNEEYKRVAKKGLNTKYGKTSKVARTAGKVARIGTKAIPVVGTAALAADAAMATKNTHDRQKGRKRWFDSPEGKNYKKYHKNRKDASAKQFAKTGKPNMKYTQAWNKKSNAPRYPSRSEFEAMGRGKSRPKPSTRPARNKPKPKKYNRKDTWG